jgi:hypothetical protein
MLQKTQKKGSEHKKIELIRKHKNDEHTNCLIVTFLGFSSTISGSGSLSFFLNFCNNGTEIFELSSTILTPFPPIF